jgi:demethylmenaquinone methyltransferase/2-methoxy-6-polyprenyl-1,4-benzoquinol methylase
VNAPLNTTPTASGARPAGASDEQSSSVAIQQMFDSIAPRYDLLNHVLSFNVDRLWWWRTARRFRRILARPQSTILDICCGTGDMTLALLKHRALNARPVLAADFSHAMLERGAYKFQSRNVVAIEADALHLPLATDSLDLITSAFGFRNLANYEAGLREFHRALRSGGELGILDFSEPGGLVGKIYDFYFSRVLPAIGSRLSGIGCAYAYLPSSVKRFPPPSQVIDLMHNAGFTQVSWTSYSLGIAGLYRAVKP